jgi:citrate synthase
MEDIAALATRRARGRRVASIAETSLAWGEPVISTSLSTARHGKLYYRGQDAMALARHANLEEVAALLWQSDEGVRFDGGAVLRGSPYAALGLMAGNGRSTLGCNRSRLCRDAADVVGVLASSAGCLPSQDPVHLRLARSWGLDGAGATRIRHALVAMADHDLNASTFAARVAASTGASMAASVLAGLCALSGPRHGGAGNALLSLLEQADRGDPASVCRRWLEQGGSLPGFGHALYPGGDPRCALMLEGITPDDTMRQVRDVAADMTGLLPNCDFAMAALVRTCGMPREAPFVIFMIGRSVGWCAHAMEQVLEGNLIRPRGRYSGPVPG